MTCSLTCVTADYWRERDYVLVTRLHAHDSSQQLQIGVLLFQAMASVMRRRIKIELRYKMQIQQKMNVRR